MGDENEKLPSEIRDAWRADEPAAGFAERTAAAWQAERAGQRQRTQRRGRSLAVGAATLALAAALLVWLRPSTVTRERVGDYEVAARTTLDVGGRATAVAEAGAALSWKVAPGGMARVEQRAGDVFYRVEKGGPFVVATAAGDVTVLGTCFRVEVQPMDRKSLVAGSVGAVAAASLMVTVYEGRVLLANEHGKTELAAGERGSVGGSTAAPTKLALTAATTPIVMPAPPAADLTRDQLLKRDEAQRQELAQLRARVQQLESQSINPDGRGPGDAFFNPPKDQLAQMAKECKLQWDSPGVEMPPHKMSDSYAQREGVSDEERRQIDQITADWTQKNLAQIRSIYVEVTGDKAGADTLSPRAMEEEIQKKVPEATSQEAYWRLSHERAGLLAPSTDTNAASPIERFLRLMTTGGDEYERELGAAIGPDRAHQLRSDNGGWGWRSTSSMGCPDGK